MLTTGVDGADKMTGGAGNDTYTAVIDGTTGAVVSTFTALDALDGGAGTDTLNLNVLNGVGNAGIAVAALPSVAVSNIETMVLRSAVALGTVGVNDVLNGGGADNATPSVSIDVSGYTGLTALNVTQATSASIKAATTTDVTISGATGALEVVQAKNVSITDATTNTSITVGSKVAAAADDTQTAGDVTGTITVTDTNQGIGNILVDGGTNVTVTASSATASGLIVVGAVDQASGTVAVTQNTNVTSDAVTAGNIAVTGGTTITVNKNSTNVASKGDIAANVTAGAITVTGGNTTTTVNVAQTHSATDFANDASLGTAEVSTVTFGSLKAGEKVAVHAGTITANTFATPSTITDLVFTATKDLTAAEVAAAFASLTAADIQTSGDKVANGTFSGTLDAGWTSGAVSGANVTFTNTAVGDQTNEITVTAVKADNTTSTTNAADFKIASKTDGTAPATTTAVDVTAATAGAVTINDNGTASITDVTVDGYATLNIGTTTALTKLANLSLANSAGTATVNTAAGITSLNLTVNNVNNQVDLDTDSTTITTVNVATTTKASSFALEADDALTLNVSGDQLLTLTSSTLTVLEKVVVTGTAGLTIGGTNEADTITSVTTTGTTGAVTIAIDGTVGTYTGGAGVDNLTLVTGTALTKAIDLGAGNDTLTLTAAVTGSTATLSGGNGEDTLSMTATRAAALDASVQTFYTSFERLTINDGAANETIDLANLGFTNYVTTTGNASTTFASAVDQLGAGTEKISFIYNGISYTSLAIAVGAADTDVNTALDGALDANNVALGAGKVTATYTNVGADITIAVDAVGNSLVGTTYLDTANITATNTKITLDKMTTNGTLVLAGTGAVTVQVTDAGVVGHTTDVLNITANVAATNYSYGTVTVANVETVNITANDTLADDNSDGTTTTAESAVEKATLTLTADKATTVNVYGAADVALTLTGSTAVTLVDGHTMTGALTVTAAGTVAETIKGGSAADSLTAATGVIDTLYGFDGNDTLTANTKTIMYGGDGADTFVINFVTASTVDDYAKIMDIGSGDIIKMTEVGTDGIAAFAKLLDANVPDAIGNPNLSSYANAAVKQNTTDNGAVWFQYNGNTFIVMEGATASATDTFQATEDNIVMISGTTVDLSTGASFNATYHTIEIA